MDERTDHAGPGGPFDHLVRAGFVSPVLAGAVDRDSEVAEFLAELLDLLREACQVLDATILAPVTGGWGGAVVKVASPHGTLALKLPARAREVVGLVTGAETLAAANLGPQVVASSVRWLAMRWLDGERVGELGRRTDLDVGHVARLVGGLGELDLAGLDDAAPVLRNRVRIGGDRRRLLDDLGADGDRVAERCEQLAEELLGEGATGWCHTDLHPANLLAGDGRWWVLDAGGRTGPREADLGWLLAWAVCVPADPRLLREACSAGGLDRELVESWQLAFAAECASSLAAHHIERREELDDLLGLLGRL